ncbi:PilW family protein [Polaromonas jejuensis]|uniref:PilW family protein n=1 Tax=Polaromonas jejuensis TaxID=457502 RepID=A0ABW0QA34_9BURK|nr:PilW family protein [Polaromonas jejuensis]
MLPIVNPTRQRLRGFSLVELMVALAIGLFGVIIIMQVFSLSEQNKLTTTSDGDAMSEGVVALYAVQRDIRMGGYGVADTKVVGCDLLLRTGVTLPALAPVTINHASITGQDANTDTLLVLYGNSNGSPQGDAIIAAGNVVQTPTAFAANDQVVEAPPAHGATCSLTLDQVASVAGSVTLKSAAVMTAGDTLFNLGQTIKVVAYAIRNGNLTMCDYTINDCGSAANNNTAAVWVPIANNIVSLRAQYGRKTTAPFVAVDVYDRSTPNTACLWSRTSAVRMALVARSAQSAAAATLVAPVWEGTFLPNSTTLDDPVVLSGNATWKNYRYKVFQTVVPVRNVAWMAGC